MKLPPRVTLDEAAALQRGWPADGSAQLIDASGLQHCDSAALALLLHARRVARQAGRELRVQAPPPQLRQLAQLYGVDELLGLAPG